MKRVPILSVLSSLALIYLIIFMLCGSPSSVRHQESQSEKVDVIRIKSLMFLVVRLYDETGVLFANIEELTKLDLYPYKKLLEPERAGGHFKIVVHCNNGKCNVDGVLTFKGGENVIARLPFNRLTPENEARKRSSFISSDEHLVSQVATNLRQEVITINRKYGGVGQTEEKKVSLNRLPDEKHTDYLKRVFGFRF